MKSCYLLRPLKVAVIYIHVPSDLPHLGLANRFAESYQLFPPLIEHSIVVVCNGSPPTKMTRRIFDPLGVRYIEHDDSGWDIGGYQKAASVMADYDLMLFLGGSSHFKREGWLARMVDAYEKHGVALYGTMGNRGNAAFKVFPHVRTTGFFMNPNLFNRYPYKVTQPGQRYEFEHGPNGLTAWVTSRGLQVWVVAWDGEYDWANWDNIPNGFHRGDQSNLLMRDRLTEPPYYHG